MDSPPRLRLLAAFATAVVCCLWSLSGCGFGTAGLVLGTQGSSEGPPPAPLSNYDLDYDERIGGSEPVPGQVMAASVASPQQLQLDTAQDYAAVWRKGAPALRTTKVRPMSPGRVSLVVPLGLPRGAYLVDVSIGTQLARIVVSVGAAIPDVPDPVAYFERVRGEWEELRQQLAARIDPADLTALDTGLAAFDGAIGSLPASEAMVVARVLKANDALRSDAPTAPYVGMDLVQDASEAASLLAERALAALGATSSLQVPEGSSAELQPLLEASLRLRAMFGVLLAYDRWRAALEQPWKPDAASDLQVTAVGGGALNVAYGVPVPVACAANCGSLVAADRAGGDPRIGAVFADLDRVTALQQGLGSAVLQILHGRVPQPPVVAVRAPIVLDPARLSVSAQAQPTLQVAVQNGQLTRYGAGPAGSTDVTFVYADGPWSTSQVASVQVQNDPQMVPIAAGTFSMGSATALAFANEAPVHAVTISRPFWMAKYELRQSEYQAVMASNPSAFPGPDLPVESVTWDEARAYCTALTTQQASVGLVPAGYHYRLPTEAEWEYCCRAGTTTEWNVGNVLSCPQANYNNEVSGSFCVGAGQTIQVGSYAANAWGLHDMHGNVWEWCLDSSELTVNYPAGAVTDPFVNGGTRRVNRGGGWISSSRFSRSPHRSATDQTFRRNFTGFRVVLAPVLVP